MSRLCTGIFTRQDRCGIREAAATSTTGAVTMTTRGHTCRKPPSGCTAHHHRFVRYQHPTPKPPQPRCAGWSPWAASTRHELTSQGLGEGLARVLHLARQGRHTIPIVQVPAGSGDGRAPVVPTKAATAASSSNNMERSYRGKVLQHAVIHATMITPNSSAAYHLRDTPSKTSGKPNTFMSRAAQDLPPH